MNGQSMLICGQSSCCFKIEVMVPNITLSTVHVFFEIFKVTGLDCGTGVGLLDFSELEGDVVSGIKVVDHGQTL